MESTHPRVMEYQHCLQESRRWLEESRRALRTMTEQLSAEDGVNWAHVSIIEAQLATCDYAIHAAQTTIVRHGFTYPSEAVYPVVEGVMPG